ALGLGLAWNPEHRAADVDAMRKFLHLWWFVPLAFWIGASERRALACLALAGAAFVAGCVFADATPSGDGRLRLGFSSINHFAQYAAGLLLGIACLAPRAWRHVAHRGVAARAALVLIGGAAAALALYWVLASGSRGVWL